MKSIHIKKYSSDFKHQWDDFVRNSKNGTFLFERDFMDYHADRFEDFSLMIFEKNKIIALLPAHKEKNSLYSHQGLTYGGFILSKKIKFEKFLQVFKAVLILLEEENIDSFEIKLVPKIYHQYPSDEIDYLLFLMKAKPVRSDLSAAILQQEALKIQSNRMEGVKKAIKNGLKVKKENTFQEFWNQILIPNLQKYHQAKPVHSVLEIEDLASKFPKNIHQFNVYKENKIIGGTTIFETHTTAHVQYIASDDNRQKWGTLDFLFHYLIEEEFSKKKYFDFGTSNENKGLNVNKGLMYWKECFGARSVVCETYKIQPHQHYLLDDVFL